MSSKRKISGVVIAVVIGCGIFVANQYFMANSSRQALKEEGKQEKESNTSDVPENNNTQSLAQVPEVRSYVAYVHNNQLDSMSGGAFVDEAAVQLVNALSTLAYDNIALVDGVEIENLRTQLNKYESTQSVEKPRQLKNLITTATGVLQKMQTKDNIALEEKLQQLRSDADAISETVAAEKQSKGLEKFFEQAAVVLEGAESNI